jgi:drug/metabolite transporter (DMT)-like permease
MPTYRMAILMGLLQVALFVALSHFALLYAGPGKTSVLVFTMPFWMIVFAHFIIHERMRGAQWIAVALAFAGLALIVAPWQLTSLGGSLLAVAAGAVWAITAVLSKRWPVAAPIRSSSPRGSSSSASARSRSSRWCSRTSRSIGTSSSRGRSPSRRSSRPRSAGGSGPTCCANTPAGITGLNSLGIPVIAVLASAIQLGERPPALELTGMALIGVALALLGWIGVRRDRAALGA